MFVRALSLAVSVTRPTSYAIDPLTSSVKVHQLLPSSLTFRSGHLHQQLQRNDIGCMSSLSPCFKKKQQQKNPDTHTRMKPANIFAQNVVLLYRSWRSGASVSLWCLLRTSQLESTLPAGVMLVLFCFADQITRSHISSLPQPERRLDVAQK